MMALSEGISGHLISLKMFTKCKQLMFIKLQLVYFLKKQYVNPEILTDYAFLLLVYFVTFNSL